MEIKSNFLKLLEHNFILMRMENENWPVEMRMYYRIYGDMIDYCDHYKMLLTKINNQRFELIFR